MLTASKSLELVTGQGMKCKIDCNLERSAYHVPFGSLFARLQKPASNRVCHDLTEWCRQLVLFTSFKAC